MEETEAQRIDTPSPTLRSPTVIKGHPLGESLQAKQGQVSRPEGLLLQSPTSSPQDPVSGLKPPLCALQPQDPAGF